MRAGWRARLATYLVVSGLAGAIALSAGPALAASAISSGASAVAASAGCQPGSGRQLAGRHFTNGELTNATTYLRCANLTGADFSGVSLIQVDFTGALLRDANFQGADLTQATLTRADLSGANLTGATLGQVTATNANFTGANLTNVDFTQAVLTGANLSHANISGASFTQATLNGTNFSGATGVPPWSMYLLIAAIVLFALLVFGVIRQRIRASLRGRSRYAISATGRRPAGLLRGVISAALIAFGFHLFAGGLIDQIVSASGPPLAQTCTAGALCKVGVASGAVGLTLGVLLFIAGIMLRAFRGSDSRRVFVGGAVMSGQQFGPGQSFGPGQQFGAGQQFGPGQQFGAGQQFGPGQQFGAGQPFPSADQGGQYGSYGPFTPGGSSGISDDVGSFDAGGRDNPAGPPGQ